MKQLSLRVIVQGIVQGVGYRYFAYHEALSRNLKGYVKNLSDGTVEVIVQGEQNLVESYLEALKRGPRSAYVRKIEVKEMKSIPMVSDFTIKF